MAKAPAKPTKKKSFKKKEKRVVHSGIVHIQATFNNTIVTIADQEGNVVSWSSAGSLGFRSEKLQEEGKARRPFGHRAHTSHLQQHHRDHRGSGRQRGFMVQRRIAGLPRIA